VLEIDIFDKYAVAERIRACFVSAVRSRSGAYSRYLPSFSRSSCFERAAQICLENGIDPDVYVMSTVNAIRCVTPEHLALPEALCRAIKQPRLKTTDESIRISSQLAKLRGQLSSGENIVDLLSNVYESFTPSFRWCVAVNVGLLSLAASYWDEARREMLMHPELVDIIKTMLSDPQKGVLDGINRRSDQTSCYTSR
jgi:hypothetical protein